MLDDIWDSWILKAFDSHFHILITSRDRSVTDSVTGKRLLFFPPSQASMYSVSWNIC